MKQTVEFAYALEQRVKILANKRVGTVAALWVNEHGHQFLVEYVTDTGSVCSDWFFPSKLETFVDTSASPTPTPGS